MDSIFGSDFHSPGAPTAENGAPSSFINQTLDVTEVVESEFNVGFNSYPMDTTTAMHTGYDDVVVDPLMNTTETLQATYDSYQAFDSLFHWEQEATGGETQRAMTPISMVTEPAAEMVDSPPPEISIEYNLRPSARVGYIAFMTWLDDDDTGDYDPKEENESSSGPKTLKQLVPKDRHKAAATYSEEERRFQDRVGKLSRAAARQNGISYVFTFKFTSEAGKQLVGSITDNWPELSWNLLSDDNVLSVITPEVQSDSFDRISSPLPWKLRHKPEDDHATNPIKEHGVQSPGNDDINRQFTSPPVIPDPAGIEEDLAGHPDARGCVNCRVLGMRCPLLEDDSTWPCYLCLEDDQECEMIIPPTKKACCIECQRKHRYCSYLDGGDVHLPCIQCQVFKVPCVAGPAEDARRERISYDRDYSQPTPPVLYPRKYVQCTACRKTHTKCCSLKSKYDKPPCQNCHDAGIPCTFEALVTKTRRKDGKHGRIGEAAPQIINGKPAIGLPNYPPLPKLKKVPPNAHVIRTCLKHPITFLYNPTDEGKEQLPCHFCLKAHYGIVGVGWRTILVEPVDSKNLAYRELRGLQQPHDWAPSGDTCPMSRMCVHCTVARTYIIGCEGHEMRPLETVVLRETEDPEYEGECEIDPEGFDLEGMYMRLLSSENNVRNILLPTDLWCSLCPSPALYRCCTSLEYDMWGEPIPPLSGTKRVANLHDVLGKVGVRQGDGCGLLLCEECRVTLGEVETLEGVLDEIERDRETKRWPYGPRADAEFLRRDSLMMANVWASAG